MQWLRRLLGRSYDVPGAGRMEVTGKFKDRSAGDRAVIEQIRGSGVDLRNPLVTTHYLYFPEDTAARKAVDALGVQGYGAQHRPGSRDDWAVLATHSLTLTPENIAAVRADLESLASELGGEYDGWEAAIRSD